MAVRNGKRPQTARLLFDYQDVNNYKTAGLRTDAGQSQIPVRGQRWVLKVVQDGVESDPSTGSGQVATKCINSSQTITMVYDADIVPPALRGRTD
jgi:hypothetical protein